MSPLFSGDCCLCLVIRRLSDRLFLLFRRGRRSWSCRRWAKTFPESLCSKKRPMCSCRYCRVKMGFLACRFGSRCLMISIIRIPVLVVVLTRGLKQSISRLLSENLHAIVSLLAAHLVFLSTKFSVKRSCCGTIEDADIHWNGDFARVQVLTLLLPCLYPCTLRIASLWFS